MLKLRPYQQESVDAVYDHLRSRDDNPVVVIPTGGGKTPVIATICQDAVSRWQGRVLIVAHVKELLQQTADKLRHVCPEVNYGVYSAGLKRRDTAQTVIVAGIQSIHRRACELGAFDLILVDEGHLIPTDGDGMYRRFLADAKIVNPRVRVVGLTATPFRTKSGVICAPDHFLNHICYEVGVKELIRDGFLCPLLTKTGHSRTDFSGVRLHGGEFVSAEAEDAMDTEDLVRAACQEIVSQTTQRHGVLVFASGVRHGKHIQQVLQQQHGTECGFLSGETPTRDRDGLLADFQNGRLRYLCNVNVLTTGFDAPHIDCVAILRPTMSPGLYYQMVGRGFRLHNKKQNCLILDFGGNVERHGPVDCLRVDPAESPGGKKPVKTCQNCQAIVSAAYACCPYCETPFPEVDSVHHRMTASTANILSQNITQTRYTVDDVFYEVHTKRGADDDAPKSMRVLYRVGSRQFQSEWVCFEHAGYARSKAEAWWQQRSPDPVPDTAQRAVEIARCGGVAAALAITVRTAEGEYARIVDHELGPTPEPQPVYDKVDGWEDEVPF